MYKVSVMYPAYDGVHFDFDYYRNTHMKMVEDHLTPFGLLKTEVLRGLPGRDGDPAKYLCIGNLYFNDISHYHDGIDNIGTVLADDIPNFTNAVPIRQLSEIL